MLSMSFYKRGFCVSGMTCVGGIDDTGIRRALGVSTERTYRFTLLHKADSLLRDSDKVSSSH